MGDSFIWFRWQQLSQTNMEGSKLKICLGDSKLTRLVKMKHLFEE